MKLWSNSFQDGAVIPSQFAFCKTDPTTHAAMSDNKNPQFQWSDLPDGTRSLVMICHDYDVPSKGDDVNQEGKIVPADLPRVDFYHWVMIDLPASTTSISESEFSNGITAVEKAVPTPCMAPVTALTTTLDGLPAIRICPAIITVTTVHVLPGTILSRIITFSRFMLWILKNCRCPAVSPDRMYSLP